MADFALRAVSRWSALGKAPPRFARKGVRFRQTISARYDIARYDRPNNRLTRRRFAPILLRTVAGKSGGVKIARARGKKNGA
jgi:hypothetical protein